MAKKVKKDVAKGLVKELKDHVQEALEESSSEEDYVEQLQASTGNSYTVYSYCHYSRNM